VFLGKLMPNRAFCRSLPQPRPLAYALIFLLTASSAKASDQTNPATVAFFESRIRPVLIEHCQECHSGDEVNGGLRVDSRDALLAGGDSGPAVAPGLPEESLLLAALRHEGFEMPPSGRLADEVVADFAAWIRAGAIDPRDENAPISLASGIDIEAGRLHWAFQPIARPTAPPVADTAWPRNEIDFFILAALEAAGLSPAVDADRQTWLRRVTFDLTGLPPTPEELEAFLADRSSAAEATVVERLLASPHYGERMARHWLDIARFAESSGGGRSMVFKEAWRYRDFVIDAFNGDMPFDRFLTEQIAGDLLSAETPDDKARLLTATGYLMLGAINYEEQDKRHLEMDVVDEQLDTLGTGLMGMTLGCARCHDHKFDPIPTDDYYALAGILRSTKTLEHSNVSSWTERELPMPPALAEAVSQHDAAVSALDTRLKAAKKRLAKLAPATEAVTSQPPDTFAGLVLDDSDASRVGEWTESTFTKPYIGGGYLHDADGGKGERTLTFQPEFEKAGRYEVRLAYTPGPNRASNVPIAILSLDGDSRHTIDMRKPPPLDAHFVSLGVFSFDTSGQWFVMISNADTDGHVILDAVQFLPLDEAPAASAGETLTAAGAPDAEQLRADVKSLEAEKKALAAQHPAVPRAMAASEADTIVDCKVCIRGDVHNTGRTVPRGVMQVATLGQPPVMPDTTSGRRELAAWLTDAEHPLTSRVFVNRVWQHLVGRGLVATPDNFGTTGSPPSHPKLLDHLARQFTDGGWSTKTLVRSIVLSHTYRQACRSSAPAAIDPNNILLAGLPRRRLDAESLRDAILSVAGTLKTNLGGPGITDAKVLSKAGSDTPSEYTFVFTDTRRSIYTPAFRNRRLELFEVFDAANPNAVVGRRPVSTVAPQALYLLNSPFVIEQAATAAQRLLAERPDDIAAQIDHAFRQTLSREPTVAEREVVLASVTANTEDSLLAWTTVYQSLFGCIDFRTLE
jgi:hypothetical protein